MNDAANRADSGIIAPKYRSTQPPSGADEELETGEPIEDGGAPQATTRKIKARVTPFDGRPPRRTSERTDTAEAPAGQMLLTTAKYMPAPPPEPDPRRTPKARRANQCAGSSGEAGGGLPGGKWGGVLAMVAAVLWFFAGLANDTLYFYPPVLFVIGLGAFMKDGRKGA